MNIEHNIMFLFYLFLRFNCLQMFQLHILIKISIVYIYLLKKLFMFILI